MKYTVERTYTPDSPHGDRTRATANFESESTDLVELALQAQLACLDRPVTQEMIDHFRGMVNESSDQLSDQDNDCFEITLFGNSGEWYLEVEKSN